MKKLLNTLYITNPEYVLKLDGETIVVCNKEEKIGQFPLHNLEGIISFGYRMTSPALMGKCMEKGISIVYLSMRGKYLASVVGSYNGNVLLRRQQYRIADDKEIKMGIAKNMILAKITNARWIIERAARDYPLRLDARLLKDKSNIMYERCQNLYSAESAEQIMGIEGEAATIYFSVFNDLILQQKDAFYFNVRNKRPPLDKVNALLSFTYSLLSSMCASALYSVGLDPYVGVLHTDRPGRCSLALDLMEEFRAVMADRFVLTLINKKIVNASGFTVKEDGAVMMDDELRKKVISAWQDKKQETITHPFLKEKIEWGMVPYVQALLLARYIRGDLEEYPPFFWK